MAPTPACRRGQVKLASSSIQFAIVCVVCWKSTGIAASHLRQVLEGQAIPACCFIRTPLQPASFWLQPIRT